MSSGGIEVSNAWVSGFVSGILAVDSNNWNYRQNGGGLHIEQTRLPDGRAAVKVVSAGFEIPPPLQDQIIRAFGRQSYNFDADSTEFEQLFPDEDGVITYSAPPQQ